MSSSRAKEREAKQMSSWFWKHLDHYGPNFYKMTLYLFTWISGALSTVHTHSSDLFKVWIYSPSEFWSINKPPSCVPLTRKQDIKFLNWFLHNRRLVDWLKFHWTTFELFKDFHKNIILEKGEILILTSAMISCSQLVANFFGQLDKHTVLDW